MRKLVLIKHALPDIEEGVPSQKWKLSGEGMEKARILSQYIKKYNTDCIYASSELKAKETGEIICKELNLELRVRKNLHENDRTGLKYLSRKEYEDVFKYFFADPDTRIVGNETAAAAKNRFTVALTNIVQDDEGEKDIVIVTHGTVISLFVSCFNDIDTFKFWSSLGLPSIVELTIPGFKITKIENELHLE